MGADVFDGLSWHPSTDLTIDDGRITGFGPTTSRPDEQAVDVSGHVIVPGLIDAHLHLFPGFLSRLPVFGVTAAVDMFATPRLLEVLRREERTEGAARFVSPGTGAASTGGHPHQLAAQGLYDPFPGLDRPDQVDAFLTARMTEGARFVKVFLEDGAVAGQRLPILSSATLRHIVDGAHDRHLVVVAHATSRATARDAVEAGVDGLAHIPIPDPLPGSVDELVRTLGDAGVFVVTTLVSLASLLGQDDAVDQLTARSRQRLGAGWQDHLTLRAGPRDDAAWGRVLELCSALAAAGTPLLAGTDAAFPGVAPGAGLHAELALLSQCGLSANHVLRAATAAPAKHLWPEGGGRLYEDGRADLVILGSDPRTDPRATQDVVATMVGGRLLRVSAKWGPEKGEGRTTSSDAK